MSDTLVVKSKVKELAKAKGVRVSADALEQLSGVVSWHIDRAIERAQGNGRKTIKDFDI